MNLRKFISGVSAFAIAASAFAGLAVTANASAYSSPYTLGENEAIDTVIIGTENADGTVTPEDFESCTTTGYQSDAINTKIGTRSSGFAATDLESDGETLKYASGNKHNVYAFGYGLAFPQAANSSNPYTFTTPITSGKLILRGDIINPQRNEYIEINGIDKDDNPISVFKFTCVDSSGSGRPDVTINGVSMAQNDTRRPAIKTRGEGTTLSAIIVDLATKTVNYTFDGATYYRVDNVFDYRGFATGTGSNNGSAQSLAALTAVTGITLGQSSSSKSTTAPTFDNVAMYTVNNAYTILPSDSDSATVSVNKAKAVAGATVQITAAAKDGYVAPYTYTVKDASDNDVDVSSDGTFTMPASNVTVTASAQRVPGYVLNSFATAGTITGTNITDAEGVDISVSTTSTEGETASIQPVSWDGRALAFNFTPTVSDLPSNTSIGALDILGQSGTAVFSIDYYNKWRVKRSSVNAALGLGSGSIVIIPSSAANLADVYVNGTKIDGFFNIYTGSERYISGIRVKSYSGITFGLDLDNFRIMDKPSTYTVTGTSAGTYIDGKVITLGDAGENMVWSDGTNTYASGASYTVTGDVTFTAAPVVTDPSAIATWVKDYTDSTEDGIKYDHGTVASVWSFVVDPGSYTINKIGLKLGDGDVKWDSHTLDVSGGPVTFAAVINKVKADVTSLALYINNIATGDGYDVSVIKAD